MTHDERQRQALRQFLRVYRWKPHDPEATSLCPPGWERVPYGFVTALDCGWIILDHDAAGAFADRQGAVAWLNRMHFGRILAARRPDDELAGLPENLVRWADHSAWGPLRSLDIEAAERVQDELHDEHAMRLADSRRVEP